MREKQKENRFFLDALRKSRIEQYTQMFHEKKTCKQSKSYNFRLRRSSVIPSKLLLEQKNSLQLYCFPKLRINNMNRKM